MAYLILFLILVVILLVFLFDRKEHLNIRRWRSPANSQRSFTAPDGSVISVEPRQVSDEWWDQNYNSGIGFQLA